MNVLRNVEFNMQTQCYSVISSQKTGKGLDLAMKFILVGALKDHYVLFESLVFRNSLNQKRKTKTFLSGL